MVSSRSFMLSGVLVIGPLSTLLPLRKISPLSFVRNPSDGPVTTNINGPTSPSYEHIIKRMDKWTSTASDRDSAVLQVVSHREFILGCHSFEEYLSPKYHTLIVLSEDVAVELRADKLVERATAGQTAGIHLFIADGETAGEMLAREVGERFAREELEPRGYGIEFLNSINCDVHQLPAGHRLFATMEELTLRMEGDFRIAKKYRSEGRHIATNYDNMGNTPNPLWQQQHKWAMPKSKMKIFAMNTILFEDIPDLDTVTTFHGIDIYEWWKKRLHKPKSLTDANLPWLYDNSEFHENHLIMYDLELLRSVKDTYFVGARSCPDDIVYIGPFANKHNLTVVRNNDVIFHINFGHSTRQLVNFGANVNLDWIKAKNFEIAGLLRNPKRMSIDWERMYNATGIRTDIEANPFMVIICIHFDKGAWLPKTFKGSTPADALSRKVLDSILSYFGYARKDYRAGDEVLQYELEGAFPGSRVVKAFRDGDADEGKWTKFLTLNVGARRPLSLFMCNYDVAECNESSKRAFSFEERLLEVPVNATIEDMDASKRCHRWKKM